ncbi:MAG: hypothetical protein NTY86_07105 [Deltaproteobacteria bacterium]|nr:hypothetical protein [Deltaproteobacteria bacterium]
MLPELVQQVIAEKGGPQIPVIAKPGQRQFPVIARPEQARKLLARTAILQQLVLARAEHSQEHSNVHR